MSACLVGWEVSEDEVAVGRLKRTFVNQSTPEPEMKGFKLIVHSTHQLLDKFPQSQKLEANELSHPKSQTRIML
jgi:hypothetical protein